jgi:hypothetical protein
MGGQAIISKIKNFSNGGITMGEYDEDFIEELNVTITDIDIPGWRLVGIMTNIFLASIPAMVIASLVVFVLTAVFGGFLAALF